MAHFDIITAATKAYKVVWFERQYLLKLATIPLAMKLFCLSFAMQYAGEPAQNLRFTLIMLPALLTEGWMLAHFVRLLMFGQRWPFRPTGNMEADLAVLSVRARGVLSGLIVFVLTNMVIGFFIALAGNFILPYMPQDGNAADIQIPPQIAAMSFVMLGFMFWGFRMIWLYIPYAVGVDWKFYLLALRGLATSIHMIGLWILCFIPVLLVTKFVGGVLGTFVQEMMGDAAGSFFYLIVTVLADTLKDILVTAGMTYVLYDFFQSRKDKAERKP